jgi:hypothetical protein
MTVPVTTINLGLTTVIFILGIWAFFKRRSDVIRFKQRIRQDTASFKATAIPSVSLFIGIAFGLFAISHAVTLAGLAKTLETFILSIRILGYLLVIVAPARILMKR